MKEYQYPLNLDWNTNEMVIVMQMWDVLEQTYEKGVSIDVFMKAHQEFKTVVRSIGEERKLGREFEELSGYSLYRTLQKAKETSTGKLRMKELR